MTGIQQVELRRNAATVRLPCRAIMDSNHTPHKRLASQSEPTRLLKSRHPVVLAT